MSNSPDPQKVVPSGALNVPRAPRQRGVALRSPHPSQTNDQITDDDGAVAPHASTQPRLPVAGAPGPSATYFDSAASLHGPQRHQFRVGEVDSFLLDGIGGESINGYVFLNRIGQGSYGSVFVVQHETTLEKFAMKIIKRKGRLRNDSCHDFCLPPGPAHPALHHSRRGSRTNLAVLADSPELEGPHPAVGVPVSHDMRSLGAGAPTPGCSSLPHSPWTHSLHFVDVDTNIRREIAIMKRLQHANIVPLYEAFDDKERHRILLRMKLITHGPLFELYNDGTCPVMSEDVAIGHLRQIAAGLFYLHHHKRIAHRDIKPGNLLLERHPNNDTTVYITDFGVSEVCSKDRGLNGARGTISFFAPEIFHSMDADTDGGRNEEAAAPNAAGGGGGELHTEGSGSPLANALGFPVDMWALGVTIYCMTVGHHPFFSTNANHLQRNVLNNAVVFPPSVDLSQEFKDMLLGLLDKDPRKRITCEELRKLPILRRYRDRIDAAVALSKDLDSSILSQNSSLSSPPPQASVRTGSGLDASSHSGLLLSPSMRPAVPIDSVPFTEEELADALVPAVLRNRVPFQSS